MRLLHVLSRHIQHALVPCRRTIHQLLLQHAPVLALRGRFVLVLLKRFPIRVTVADCAVGRNTTGALRTHEKVTSFLLGELRVEHCVLSPSLHWVLHNPLVAFLSLHQLLDHGAILLVDGRLVGVRATDRLRLIVVTSVLARAGDLG